MRFLLLLFFFLSCSGESDRHGRLADAYADILRFRDASARADTSAVRRGIDSVLAGYGLTTGQFLAGFRELTDDPASFQPFFLRVEVRLAATSGTPPASREVFSR